MPYYIILIVAYFYSTIIGHLFTKGITIPLWKLLDEEYLPGPGTSSTVQGIIERILYTASFQLQFQGFVAVWLVLKATSQWKNWKIQAGYNVFLVGSGLSVIHAFIGAKLIVWISSSDWEKAILYPIALGIGTLILRFWIKRQNAPLTPDDS